MEKKEITPEEMSEIKAIDVMCRPFYPSRDVLKKMFQSQKSNLNSIGCASVVKL